MRFIDNYDDEIYRKSLEEPKYIEENLEEQIIKDEIIELSSDNYLNKRMVKSKAKSEINKKFVRGSYYFLKDKCSNTIKEFELKQIIWTINDNIINALIMKQISGPNNSIFTLNKYDCKKFHIKFEPGLQIFSMDLNWILKK